MVYSWLTSEDCFLSAGFEIGVIFARTFMNPKGALIRHDGQASIEWKAGTIGRRTHLILGFEQNLRTAQVDGK